MIKYPIKLKFGGLEMRKRMFLIVLVAALALPQCAFAEDMTVLVRDKISD